jgi:hypothetical protein
LSYSDGHHLGKFKIQKALDGKRFKVRVTSLRNQFGKEVGRLFFTDLRIQRKQQNVERKGLVLL